MEFLSSIFLKTNWQTDTVVQWSSSWSLKIRDSIHNSIWKEFRLCHFWWQKTTTVYSFRYCKLLARYFNATFTVYIMMTSYPEALNGDCKCCLYKVIRKLISFLFYLFCWSYGSWFNDEVPGVSCKGVNNTNKYTLVT